MPELERSKNILENLTLAKGKCLVCGEWAGGMFENEVAVVWVGCSCGHVFALQNKITWH